MRWIIKRLIFLVITLFVTMSITFVLIRLMPGNPVDAYVSYLMQQGLSYGDAVKMAASLYSINLDQPLWLQYFDYIKNLLQGNLGYSYTSGAPVIEIIATVLPWTVFLVSISLTISFLVGIALGIYAAYRKDSLLDSILSLTAITLNSIPNYVVALILCIIFSLYITQIPVGGAYDPNVQPGLNWEFISSVFAHAFVPMLAYVVTSFGGWLLGMRASMISVLRQDYIMAAEARGLPKTRIMLTYAGKNAILPLFTSLVIQIGYMFGGALFIENIFVYPGIGYTLNLAVSSRDYPLMQGCFLLISIAVVLGNFIADLLYGKIDPRIRMR